MDSFFRASFLTLLLSANFCFSELFYFPAVSPSTMGTAFAGAPAGVEDITQQFFNPAVTAYFHEHEAAAVGSILFPNDNFDGAAGQTFNGFDIFGPADPRNVSPHIGGGALYGSFVLGNRFRLGFAATTPWRKKTSYAHDWVGRYYGTRFDVIGINLSPTLSWSIHDVFYIGIGPQFQSMSMNYEEAIDFGSLAFDQAIQGAVPGGQDGYLNVSGNDWDFGYVVGVIFKPCWYLRLGASYRSQICHHICATPHFDLGPIGREVDDFTGGEYSRACTAEVNLNTPGTVWAGFHYYHNECCEAMGSVSFREWSGSDDLKIQFGDDSILNTFVAKPGWRDTLTISGGVKCYNSSREWYLRGGAMYQENPVKSHAQNPLLFGNATGSVGAGIGCSIFDCIFFDMAWFHTFPVEILIDQNAAQTGNAQKGDLTGSIYTQSDYVSFSIVAEY